MRRIYIDGVRELGVGEGRPWPSPARLEGLGELVRYNVALADRLLRAEPESCWVRVRHRAAEPIEARGYQVDVDLEDGKWYAYALWAGRAVGRGWGSSPAAAIQALAGELGIPMEERGNDAGCSHP